MTLVLRIAHRFARFTLAAELEAAAGTTALVGPSGAGKTSVLRAAAGLLAPDDGRIALGARVLFDRDAGVNLPPEARRVGLVFQDGALFPHLTVAANVAFGIRPRRMRRTRVLELLDRFGVARLAGARPAAISGGERRRVALARALAGDPESLLLDEPLSGLDPVTRGLVADELSRHLAAAGVPAVIVSHDLGDVLGLADRVAVMERGRIVQAGPPDSLLQAPASPFVAAFAGVNYLTGTAARAGDLTEVRSDAGGAVFLTAEPATGPVAVIVPPWEVTLTPGPPEGSARNALAGPVSRVVPVGNRIRVTLGSRPPVVAEITADAAAALGVSPGRTFVATWKATGTRVLPRPR